MAPKKKPMTKAKKAAAAAAEPKARAHKKAPAAKKKTAVKAAYAHSAAISHSAAAPEARRHTYTDHRSESYKHYASIMRTIIVFLACVLALVILARIFIVPAENQISATRAASAEDNSRLRFLGSAPSAGGGFDNLDSTDSGYVGYQGLRGQSARP